MCTGAAAMVHKSCRRSEHAFVVGKRAMVSLNFQETRDCDRLTWRLQSAWTGPPSGPSQAAWAAVQLLCEVPAWIAWCLAAPVRQQLSQPAPR